MLCEKGKNTKTWTLDFAFGFVTPLSSKPIAVGTNHHLSEVAVSIHGRRKMQSLKQILESKIEAAVARSQERAKKARLKREALELELLGPTPPLDDLEAWRARYLERSS